METIRFAKMSGAGNDFLALDNRQGQAKEVDTTFIRKVCTRGLSVGADGVIMLSTSLDADFEMRYFNADGSEAAMCGNGGRCIARFAVLLGVARENEWMQFTAPSGRYTALVKGSDVTLQIIPPQSFQEDITLSLSIGERHCGFTNTGVPHAVFFSEHIETEDVFSLGREVRQHPFFSPAGTNVNFCQITDQHHMLVRTYERGVENETLACGTGVAAAVLLAARGGKVQSPVTVKTQGGIELELKFEQANNQFTHVYQRGEARLIYWGELSPEATMI